LEAARDLDVVVFDKTGTLTRGEQGLVELATTDGFDESEALSLAAAVEGDGEHMVARALIDAARERGPLIPAVHGFQSLPGRGEDRHPRAAGRGPAPARTGPRAAPERAGRARRRLV
jgi:P-type Cu2+ transporter